MGASYPGAVPPLPPARAGFFARVLAAVRRASSATYRAVVLVLLAVTYVVVLPWFAAAWRIAEARPRHGWRLRSDPGLASIERLRSLF